MQTLEHLQKYPCITKQEVESCLHQISEHIAEHLHIFTEKFKGPNSIDGFYPATDNTGWTNGFWTGQIWLAYEATQDERFKHAASIQVQSFLSRIEQKIDVAHHDMGFLYSLSCVAAYQLTGDEAGKKAAILAAQNLIQRFQEKGEFIQAWGELGAADNYRLIIDCLLNIPLLYRATDFTGDPIYEEIGIRHVKTAMNCIIRPDHSTFHTYYFDPDTGKPLRGATHQGNRDGSAWGRGQAWGIYGAALSYKKLRDQKYMQIFEELSEFFLLHLPDNLIPYWDFDFDDPSTEPRDSSCAAIAACAMLEMAKYMDEQKAAFYTTTAKQLLHALAKNCMVQDNAKSNGILLHGTYCKSTATNTCPNIGVDECVAWGDYFFMEALLRLYKDWDCYW